MYSGTKISESIFNGQGGVQTVLLLFAFISFPCLLLGKPLLERRDARRKAAYQNLDEEHGESNEAPFEFGEVMVKQMIHTIEYVLGCVSNTASYLRLWALSLAHAQLSEVFWEKLFVEQGLHLEHNDAKSVAMVFVLFAVWSALTFAVLMLM